MGGRGADGDGTAEEAAIVDVDGNDAGGGAIGNVHFGFVGSDDGGGGSGAEEHGVAHFVGPGVDGLQAVGVGRDDVNFAAVGLEKHLRGSAGEFEIGEKRCADEIDDGEALLRATHDEGERGIGSDDDFVGLRNDGNGIKELECAGVVDGKQVGAAIDDDDIFCVGSEASLHGFGVGVSAAVDLAGSGVDGDELVGGGSGGVDAITGGRKIERVREWADRDAGELVGGGVEDEDIAAGGRDAPDFVAGGVLAKIGDAGADGNFGDGLEFGEIDDSERAVGGGNVGVHVEIGAKEGWTMLFEDDGDGGDEKDEKNEIGAEVFRARHLVSEFYMRVE